MSITKSLLKYIIFLFCIPIALLSPVSAKEIANSKVLYLNSYHSGYSWSDNIKKGLRDTLNTSDKKIELSIEFLDSRRFINRMQDKYIAESIKVKYSKYKFNLLIVSDNAAFDFAIKYRDELFKDIPIVFCGYNLFRSETLKKNPNITGVNEEISIESTVDMAVKVHPKTRNIVFVTSTAEASNRRMSEHAEEFVFPKLKEEFNLTVLKDNSTIELKNNVEKLPKNTLVFIIGHVSNQGEGRSLSPVENAKIISEISPFPVYTYWNFHLNQGVIGGQVITGYEQGKTAGELALKILEGESATDIPVVMTSPVTNIFDYNVMKKFGVRPSDLPQNSNIINKPNSILDDYYKEIIFAVILLIFQTLLIFFLIKNRKIKRELVKELAKEKRNLEERVKQRTIELEESKTRYELLSTLSFDAIFLSQQGQIKDVNTTVESMFGYSKEQLQNLSLLSLVHPDSLNTVISNLKRSNSKPYEVKVLTKNKETLHVEVHAQDALLNGETYRVSTLRDITDKKRVEELSVTDKLTTLFNRLKLDEVFVEEIERSKRYAKQFSIVLMDIDNFKSVNDRYGHQVGDQVLIEASNILKANIRKTDVIGRWGGEEFLIICPESNITNTSVLAEKLRRKIEEYKFSFIGSKTMSFGVTAFYKDDSVNDLLERADKALYHSKNNGKNKVSVFDENRIETI